MPCRGQGGGRIHVHQRNVDDGTAIIRGDAPILEEHSSEITATEQSQMEDRTRKEYRNRIRHIYRWWMEAYPEYFEQGAYVLSDDQKRDRVAFHHTNERDLIYSGLNVQMVKSFLSVKKKKRINADGKAVLASISDIKKYDDAIKWGS